jgi:uncharacterized Zn-binding protein involved in type VI secretion
VTKKYDPLWEIVDEKVALQGQEPDVDAPCPHCHVLVHLGGRARVGDRFACGLCGGHAVVIAVRSAPDGVALQRVAPGE